MIAKSRVLRRSFCHCIFIKTYNLYILISWNNSMWFDEFSNKTRYGLIVVNSVRQGYT